VIVAAGARVFEEGPVPVVKMMLITGRACRRMETWRRMVTVLSDGSCRPSLPVLQKEALRQARALEVEKLQALNAVA
jgi:hypothetical protein